MLENGRSLELEKLCQQKLSNYGSGNKPFTWFTFKTKGADNAKKQKSPSTAAPNTTPPSTATPTPTSTSTTPTTPTTPLIFVPDPSTITLDHTLALSPAMNANNPTTINTPNPSTAQSKIDDTAAFQIAWCEALDLDDLIACANLDRFVASSSNSTP